MIRVGIVDFDSSHSVEFTKILNHKEIADELWVEGARVVAGCALPSAIMDDAGVRANAGRCEAMGVALLERPEDLIGLVDAVMIESDDGRTHLERARPFLLAGIPTFVDKPFSFSVADCREMIGLAEKHQAPLFSASSLRYAPEVVEVTGGRYGSVLGALTYSPAKDQGPNPGLVYYGIHATEMLFALMGPGCQWVSGSVAPQGHMLTAAWADGRLASLRGTTAGPHAFGFTAWCETAVTGGQVSTRTIYRELMKEVVSFFGTGVAPVSPHETLEMIAFGQAALLSEAKGGERIRVAS